LSGDSIREMSDKPEKTKLIREDQSEHFSKRSEPIIHGTEKSVANEKVNPKHTITDTDAPPKRPTKQ